MLLAFASALLLSIFVSGCATTTSIWDNKNDVGPYTNILVYLHVSDLEVRQQGEETIAEHFREGGLVGIPSNKLFFPSREYTPIQILRILEPYSPKALLVVAISGEGSSHSYIPPAVLSGSDAISTSIGVAGKPWASFRASLLDVADGRVVWISTGELSGSRWTGAKGFLSSEEIVTKLAEDNMLPEIFIPWRKATRKKRNR